MQHAQVALQTGHHSSSQELYRPRSRPKRVTQPPAHHSPSANAALHSPSPRKPSSRASAARSKAAPVSQRRTVTPAASRHTNALPGSDSRSPDEDAGNADYDEDGGITRCVCGNNEESAADGLMIQCETCKAWQHGPCVGLHDEKSCPDTYYCEQCRPDLHPLQTSRRSKSIGRSRSSAAANDSSKADRTSVEFDKISNHSADDDNKPSSASAPVSTGAGVAPLSGTKRRNTMNSRDADYEENLARAIAESGTYRRKDEKDKDSVDSGHHPKRRKKEIAADEDAPIDIHDSSRPRENQEPESKPSSNVGKYRSGRGKVQDVETESIASVKAENIQSDNQDQAKHRLHSPPFNDDESSASLERVTDAPATSSRSRSRKRQKTTVQNHDDDNEETESRKTTDDSDSKSKTAPQPNPSAQETPPSSNVAPKSKRAVDKRQREESEDGGQTPSSAVNSSKPKHPNQYTYRSKSTSVPRSRISPSKRQPLDGTRNARDGRRGHRASSAELEAQINTTWGLPEHLSHLVNLLPTPQPVPIDVPSLTTIASVANRGASIPSTPRTNANANVNANAPQSPSTPNLNENGNSNGNGNNSNDDLVSSDTSTPPNAALKQKSMAQLPTHKEAATRVRFPSKRMTFVEMKKRTRNVMDYICRMQSEMVKPGDCADATSGIENRPSDSAESSSSSSAESSDVVSPETSSHMAKKDAENVLSTSNPKISNLMDELTSEIIQFQEKFLS